MYNFFRLSDKISESRLGQVTWLVLELQETCEMVDHSDPLKFCSLERCLLSSSAVKVWRVETLNLHISAKSFCLNWQTTLRRTSSFTARPFTSFKILNFLFVSWCEVGQHETDRIGSDKTGDTISHIP